MVYSAILLTAVQLLLRLTGTGFQIYLSRELGPGFMGLLQMILSVGNLATVAGTAGIRTGCMYLSAGALGRRQPEKIPRILSACFLYSILFSGGTAVLLWLLAPRLSEVWIGNADALPALRLLAGFLPTVCLCGVLSGYFTAAKRIGALAAVEVLDQLFTAAATVVLLKTADPGTILCAVPLGSCLGAMMTLILLFLLRIREKGPDGGPFPLRNDLLRSSLPLAAGDLLRSGISTMENLTVPRRLALCPGVTDALGAFGLLGSMVFPILMFPSSLLFGLCELLIPELARCHAAGNRDRVEALVRKSLRLPFFYGIFVSGLLRLAGPALCDLFFSQTSAGLLLTLYAPLVPMLYCDMVVDAMTKGLGQQRACVRYNILTNALDVMLLYFLLPIHGLRGYFLSFVLTHLLNFLLSLGRLLRITRQSVRPLTILLPLLAGHLIAGLSALLPHLPSRLICYCLLMTGSFFLYRQKNDLPKQVV